MLLVSGGDDQAIQVARLSLEWPLGGGAPRLQCRASLRLPNAHGSAVRVRVCAMPYESCIPRLPYDHAVTLSARNRDREVLQPGKW